MTRTGVRYSALMNSASVGRQAFSASIKNRGMSRSALFDGFLSKLFDGVPVPVPAPCRGLRESEPGNEFGEKPIRPGGGEAHAGHPARLAAAEGAVKLSATLGRPTVTNIGSVTQLPWT
jgi:hypothetical protein